MRSSVHCDEPFFSFCFPVSVNRYMIAKALVTMYSFVITD